MTKLKKKTQQLKNIIKYNQLWSNLVYDSKYSFWEYQNITNLNSLSLESKYPKLASFYNDLSKFHSLQPQKGRTKEKKSVHDNTSGSYNFYIEFLEI